MLQETAAAITATTGREVLPLQMDIRKPEAVTKALDDAENKFGLATIIINNAAGNFIAVRYARVGYLLLKYNSVFS